jgi:hypothetical protein
MNSPFVGLFDSNWFIFVDGFGITSLTLWIMNIMALESSHNRFSKPFDECLSEAGYPKLHGLKLDFPIFSLYICIYIYVYCESGLAHTAAPRLSDPVTFPSGSMSASTALRCD